MQTLLFLILTKSVKLLYILAVSLIMAGMSLILWTPALKPLGRILGVTIIKASSEDLKTFFVLFFHNELLIRILFLTIFLFIGIIFISIFNAFVLSEKFSRDIFYGRFKNFFVKAFFGSSFFLFLFIFIGSSFFLTYENKFPESFKKNPITKFAETKSVMFDLKTPNLDLKTIINFGELYEKISTNEEKIKFIQKVYNIAKNILSDSRFLEIKKSKPHNNLSLENILKELKKTSSTAYSQVDVILPKIKTTLVIKIKNLFENEKIKWLIPQHTA